MGVSISQLSNYVPLTNKQRDILDATLESMSETNEGAISLFTGGGKTYIALAVACKYIIENPGKKVLWCGPKSPNRNVEQSEVFRKLLYSISQNISMKSYEELSRSKIDLDVRYEDVCLVIMDESHRALAKQCYPHLADILQRCNCAKLAMSATQQRTDGRKSFESLVPSAKYHDYDINWAADNNIINDINYYLCTTKLSRFDFAALDMYEKLAQSYSDVKEQVDGLREMLYSYHFNFRRDFYEVLKRSDMNIDGSTGDRHIVFFNTIDTLKARKNDVEEVFKRLYPMCNVTVYEFHSKQSSNETKRVLKEAVNSIPEPWSVDVIITVNKGNESIHPRNIKSVSMFRNTASHIIFLQQLGRGITIRDYCDDGTFIFDFSEGFVTLLRGTSVEYGRRSLARKERVGLYSEVATIDELAKSLKDNLSRKIKIKEQFATPQLRELSAKLSTFMDAALNGNRVNEIFRLVTCAEKNYKNEWKAKPDLSTLLVLTVDMVKNKLVKTSGEIDANGKMSQDLLEWFTYTRDALIRGRIDDKTHLHNTIQKCGHLFYHSNNCGDRDEELMYHIDVIDRALNSVGRDEKQLGMRSISRKYLTELRIMSILSTIPVNVAKYARDKDIDLTIAALKIAEIGKLAPKGEEHALADYEKEIKLAEELFNMLQDENHSNQDAYNTWVKLMARHYVNKAKHRSTFALYIRQKIVIKYDDELKYCTLSKKDKDDGNTVIGILMKYERKEVISGLYQSYIFNNYDLKNVSDYIREIFREFGIKSKQTFQNLADSTSWMRQFNSAVNGNIDDMTKLRAIDIKNMDPYRQKMLRTAKFREIKKITQDEVDTQLVIRMAKSLFEPDVEVQNKISRALKNGVVEHIDIALAPFRAYIKDIAKQLLEYNGTVEDYIANYPKQWSKLYSTSAPSESLTNERLTAILGVKALDNGLKDKLIDIQSRITK